MANDLQFAGIEPGHILKGQIQNLADVIETRLRDPHYIKVMGDFRDRFRLIRYGNVQIDKFVYNLSHVMRKRIFRVCDQIRLSRSAQLQRLASNTI